MTALEKAQELMHLPMKDLPPLARDFAADLCREVGGCGETMLTAFAVYAQVCLKLPCGDPLYQPRPQDVLWFRERTDKVPFGLKTQQPGYVSGRGRIVERDPKSKSRRPCFRVELGSGESIYAEAPDDALSLLKPGTEVIIGGTLQIYWIGPTWAEAGIPPAAGEPPAGVRGIAGGPGGGAG
jgi:hypothetical protein